MVKDLGDGERCVAARCFVVLYAGWSGLWYVEQLGKAFQKSLPGATSDQEGFMGKTSYHSTEEPHSLHATAFQHPQITIERPFIIIITRSSTLKYCVYKRRSPQPLFSCRPVKGSSPSESLADRSGSPGI